MQAYSPKYKFTYPPDVKESHLSNRHWPKPPQKSSDRQRSCSSRGGPAITVWAYSLKQHLLCVFLIIFVPTRLGSQDCWLRVPSVSRAWRHVLAIWALGRKRHKDEQCEANVGYTDLSCLGSHAFSAIYILCIVSVLCAHANFYHAASGLFNHWHTLRPYYES